MIAALITLLAGLAGIGVKVWLATRKSASQKVAITDHAMLEDAANRPDDDTAIDRLRHGTG